MVDGSKMRDKTPHLEGRLVAPWRRGRIPGCFELKSLNPGPKTGGGGILSLGKVFFSNVTPDADIARPQKDPTEECQWYPPKNHEEDSITCCCKSFMKYLLVLTLVGNQGI